jgi:2-dehydro-3-deoxyphosphogluconate aldolase/(4S)-4-hydroxy-2-oxoglutarate aldolase
MSSIFDEIRRYGIVPVIKLAQPSEAIPLARALLEAGLPVAEITFRTGAAKEAIKTMRAKFPTMLIGAGTVITLEQIAAAQEAGAMFIVTPGFNPKIVDACRGRELPTSPSQRSKSSRTRSRARLSLLNFFPA